MRLVFKTKLGTTYATVEITKRMRKCKIFSHPFIHLILLSQNEAQLLQSLVEYS